MAQHRQSVFDRLAGRSHDHLPYGNGAININNSTSSDHVAIGIRAASHKQANHRARRPGHKGGGSGGGRRISIGTVAVVLCLVLAVTVLVYVCISGDDKEINKIGSSIQDDDFKSDFLSNVSRINTSEVKFGHGSVAHGRDSRYWDGDDRRRDEDYSEEVMDESSRDEHVHSHSVSEKKSTGKKSSSHIILRTNHHGLYNEAGRDELKMYEKRYEASLKDVGQTGVENQGGNQVPADVNSHVDTEDIDMDDEYDDGINLHDASMDEYEDDGHDAAETKDDRDLFHDDGKTRDLMEEADGASKHSSQDKVLKQHGSHKVNAKSKSVNVGDGRSTKSSRKRKRRSSCDLKFSDSTTQLVEPLENKKFVRFSLQYTETETKPDQDEHWEPRFAGHQSLQEREDSFIARDQTINCGFVRGPSGYPSTGFDLAEDDSRYISKCHIAVVSCIFGNSDRLRSPTGKTVSRISKKNVCFVMFMDETSLQTISSEGQMPDRMGFIGMWKIVVVKNLPYDDMRRVGKIPKLLPHRLFPSARYSIWLDSKLRLQRDPLLILEYFLWRKGHEYAISNHYDRHCVWEEVAQNKKLNKYNHTIIDQQFSFYQADGLKRFNGSDHEKLLPSNVPEGSFIIRAHTPMSNLFSCLWFNEVDRFTPRDQLSFAYTYQKLRTKNPGKPLYLNMFKDCERRMIAKLYHHRTQEKHDIGQETSE